MFRLSIRESGLAKENRHARSLSMLVNQITKIKHIGIDT